MSERFSFFAELKRRNVYKVAVAYIVAGWALAQGIAQVLPVFDTPNWLIRLLVVLIILGLPVALAMARAFESPRFTLGVTNTIAPSIYCKSW